MLSNPSYSVLVVDDNASDLELLRRAIGEIGDLPITVEVAENGLEAVEVLEKRGPGSRPDLAIVDLKMPRVDGRGFLRWVRNEPPVSTLPVLILSTSRTNEDIDGCYRDGCNAYFQKPLEYHDLVELMDSVVRHWLGRVQLPRANAF